MTSPGYAHGISGLARYLDMTPKSVRKILKRVQIPTIKLPGVVRETTLFKLADVDEALLRYRTDAPAPTNKSIDIDSLVDEIVGGTKGGDRERT